MTIVSLATNADVKYTYRVNKETKLKRPDVELKVPQITIQSIAEYLSSEDKKVSELVIETLQGTLNAYIRGFVDADPEFDQAKLDALFAEGKLGFEALANIPRAERNTLTNEDLAAFGKEYFKLAQELLGKTEGQALAAVTVFNSRVKKIAGNIPALNKVAADLEKFLDVAPEDVLGEHARALQYLIGKVAEYQTEDITADSL